MSDSITPMMSQYRRIKAELPPGTILFFRLGDFYEMFFEDAVEASRILDIALTKRQYIDTRGLANSLVNRNQRVTECEHAHCHDKQFADHSDIFTP